MDSDIDSFDAFLERNWGIKMEKYEGEMKKMKISLMLQQERKKQKEEENQKQ